MFLLVMRPSLWEVWPCAHATAGRDPSERVWPIHQGDERDIVAKIDQGAKKIISKQVFQITQTYAMPIEFFHTVLNSAVATSWSGAMFGKVQVAELGPSGVVHPRCQLPLRECQYM